MEEIKDSEVFKILKEINDSGVINACRNERYLHHYFTRKIQNTYPIVYEDFAQCKLHPEWATLIKGIRNGGGKYKKKEKEYRIDEADGTSGFIDFALGSYDSPEIGLEFKVCRGWIFQSLVFDYMKLLDSVNSIEKAVSFSIIYREKNHSSELSLDKINETITALTDRLGCRLATSRKFLFWIIEIVPNGKKNKSWYCDNLEQKFVEKTPY